jgi:hypothetical protein
MSVYNVSVESTSYSVNDKLASNSSANILADTPHKRNRLTLISNSNANLNGHGYKKNQFNNSIVTLMSQQVEQQQKAISFIKLNENLLKCKAVKTYQTAQPKHLSFDLNDTIVITNNSGKDFWVSFIEYLLSSTSTLDVQMFILAIDNFR